jgi:hypothetical protein
MSTSWIRAVRAGLIPAGLLAPLLVAVCGAHASTWAPETSGTTNNLYAVSCSDANNCWAVGGSSSAATILHTANSSSAVPSWSAQSAPRGATNYNGVSCASSSDCIATGSSLAGAPQSAYYNGTSWTSLAIPSQVSSTASLRAASCPTTSDCAAVTTIGGGTNPLVIDNTTAGGAWSAKKITAASYALYGISCPSTALCVAVGGSGSSGNQIVYSTNPFNATPTWSVASSVPATYQLNAVSCPTTTLCVAVGNSSASAAAAFLVSTNPASQWSSVSTNIPRANLMAVSCADATHCWAAGAGGAMVTSTNPSSTTSWATQSSGTTGQIEGLDIHDLAFGKAVGDSGTLLGYTGCNSGGYNIMAPSSFAWPSTVLTGTDQTINATSPISITADDESGAGSGWKLQLTSTSFTSSGHQLPTSAATITSGSAALGTGGCTAVATNTVTYPLTVPAAPTAPTAVDVFTAAAASGAGPQTVSLQPRLTIPANAYNGSYSSTWTFTIASGP